MKKKYGIAIIGVFIIALFLYVKITSAGYWQITDPQGNHPSGDCPNGICTEGWKRECIGRNCPGDNEGEGGGGGGGGGGTATCIAQTFVSASVAPSTLRPFDQVTVKCNYGKRLDNISIIGAGLKNCRYSRYEGTNNIFACEASANAGFYDDTMCVTAANKDCKEEKNKVGDINIIGSEVSYDQDIVLRFGTYTFSATAFSVISKGTGNKVSLICNSATCNTGVKQGEEVSSLVFVQGTDFTTLKKTVSLKGTGDDRHYLIKVGVDKGGEAYFDSVSLKDAKQIELIKNGDFRLTYQSSVTTKQPTAWGEGDNKVGYYYGSLADEVFTVGPGGGESIPGSDCRTWSGGCPPTPTPGKASPMTFNIKIKLQGIVKKPKTADPLTVLVKLDGATASFATQSKSVVFTVDDAGVWSGKADFSSVPTGGGYKVYIKAPKHIQKKICSNIPTEDKGGTYHCGDGAITLTAGENTLDFSKILQLAGDLPEANGKQNGIVDAYDTTFIRTNLGSTDATKLKTGDLNLDGINDTQDYSMVLQSLSIKYDEE